MPRDLRATWRGVAVALTAVLAVVLSALAASPAQSHTRSQSFSRWTLEPGRVQVQFHASAVEVTRLGALHSVTSLDELLAVHLRQSLEVSAGGAPCELAAEPSAQSNRKGRVSADLVFACPSGNLHVVNNAFFAVAPSHLHFARFADAAGGRVEKLFTDAERAHLFLHQAQQPQPWWLVFYDYFVLGAEHILIGADHLAFVLCLLLLCGFTSRLVFAISGFTLGHSLALGLAVFDVVRPNIAAVEALIGFSIVIVALEWLVKRLDGEQQVRVALGYALLLGLAALWSLGEQGAALGGMALLALALFTLCYPLLAARSGTTLILLITAFGFSSALLEIGLPSERLATSLVAFNLGVEAGQLLFCGVLLVLGVLFLRWLPQTVRPVLTGWLVAVLGALGTFWFASRGFLS